LGFVDRAQGEDSDNFIPEAVPIQPVNQSSSHPNRLREKTHKNMIVSTVCPADARYNAFSGAEEWNIGPEKAHFVKVK
jgi:hypothetical protein